MEWTGDLQLRYALMVAALFLCGIVSIGAHIPESNGYDTLSVQVIYAIPSDREEKPEYREAIAKAMNQVLEWYVEQLDITSIEVTGELPQVCRLQKPTAHFAREKWPTKVSRAILQDCMRLAFYDRSVYIIFVDIPAVCQYRKGSALGDRRGMAALNESHIQGLSQKQSHCGLPQRTPDGYAGTLAHELGHAFGLEHPDCETDDPTCHRKDIMWETRHFPDAYIDNANLPRLHNVLQRGLPYFGPP